MELSGISPLTLYRHPTPSRSTCEWLEMTTLRWKSGWKMTTQAILCILLGIVPASQAFTPKTESGFANVRNLG